MHVACMEHVAHNILSGVIWNMLSSLSLQSPYLTDFKVRLKSIDYSLSHLDNTRFKCCMHCMYVTDRSILSLETVEINT